MHRYFSVGLMAVALMNAAPADAGCGKRSRGCDDGCGMSYGHGCGNCGYRGFDCGGCGSAPVVATQPAPAPAPAPAPQMVEQTVYEQQWKTVNQKVKVVECVPVQKSRVVQVARCVATQKQVPYEYTEIQQAPRTRAENYFECVPVVTPQKRMVTEMTHRVESRPVQFTKCVPVVEQVTVVDRGCGGCGDCGGCGRAHRHKGCGGCDTGCGGCGDCAPVTTRVVCVTRYVRQVETRNVNVTVCVPVQKEITVNVTTYQKVPKTRQVNYIECVPVKRQGQRMVTEYNTVMEPRQENYVEMTQRTVEKDVQVRVCEMVAKKIMVPVAPVVAAPCGGCGDCGHGCDSGCGGKHGGLFGGRKCR